MNLVISKKNEFIDYENEILDFIRENHSGVTITDISKKTDYSRNTVSKYVAILHLKGMIYNEPVGRYNLYFSSKKSFISKNIMHSMFKAIFLTMKNIFPNKEDLYKEFGKELQNHFDYRYSKGFFSNNIKKKIALKNIKDFKPHFEYFVEVFNSFNVLQDTVQVTHIKYENNYKKAIYRFTDSEFLETNDDYIFYFYMIAGIIETYLGGELNRNVNSNIIDIHISDKKEESYVDISIEIE